MSAHKCKYSCSQIRRKWLILKLLCVAYFLVSLAALLQWFDWESQTQLLHPSMKSSRKRREGRIRGKSEGLSILDRQLSDFKQQERGREENSQASIRTLNNSNDEGQSTSTDAVLYLSSFVKGSQDNPASIQEISINVQQGHTNSDGNDFKSERTVRPPNPQLSSSNNSANIAHDIKTQRREKLQYKLQRIPQHLDFDKDFSFAHHHQEPLWELSDFLPPWMKDYFSWHQEERQKLTEGLWGNEQNNSTSSSTIGSKLLVVQCLHQSHSKQSVNESSSSSCGSLSERLLLLPYWLRMAYETNRILFLHWTSPVDLSNFFEPPGGGCDWRAPIWLQYLLEDERQGLFIQEKSQLLSGDDDYFKSLNHELLIKVQLKSAPEFEDRYNALRKNFMTIEATFDEVFHDVWKVFFVPSLRIRKEIENAFSANKMLSGEYVSVDLSADSRFTMATSSLSSPAQPEKVEEHDLIEKAKRVVECASRLRPKGPFLVVTDDLNITRALQSHYAATGRVPVFARYIKPKQRKNTDKSTRTETELLPQILMDLDATSGLIHRPESYYDIFVNLYLMAMGHGVVTVTSNQGSNSGNSSAGSKSLSRLAALIGYDPSRLLRYTSNGCSIAFDESSTPPSVVSSEIHANRSIPDKFDQHFSTPMIGDGADHLRLLTSHLRKEGRQQHQQLHAKNASTQESNLPQWMEEYFEWHRSIKSNLTRSNSNSTKFLILSCVKDKSCGGISDRLKPLPMIVWEAYQSQRLLLIWWDRPKPLEEWLVPPKHNEGGIDWTVPAFLKKENLRSSEPIIVNSLEKGKQYRELYAERRAIFYRIQTPMAGEDIFFDEQIIHAANASSNNGTGTTPRTVASSYRDIFHHLWRRFFAPAPRLAASIDSKMKQHGLVPGRYTSVHLRAMYGNRKHRDPQETVDLAVLGVNCASNLFPGATIFFASDTSFAVAAAHTYKNLYGLPIASLDYGTGMNADIGINTSNSSKNSNGNNNISNNNNNNNNNDASKNPIHLDKDPDWKKRPASAYDSTFIDLYMLAESRCVARSNGGYGDFGSMLSHDPKCQMRFFKGRKAVKHCIWMNEDGKRQKLKAPNATDVPGSSGR